MQQDINTKTIMNYVIHEVITHTRSRNINKIKSMIYQYWSDAEHRIDSFVCLGVDEMEYMLNNIFTLMNKLPKEVKKKEDWRNIIEEY